jgi:hypothetical protein
VRTADILQDYDDDDDDDDQLAQIILKNVPGGLRVHHKCLNRLEQGTEAFPLFLS